MFVYAFSWVRKTPLIMGAQEYTGLPAAAEEKPTLGDNMGPNAIVLRRAPQVGHAIL